MTVGDYAVRNARRQRNHFDLQDIPGLRLIDRDRTDDNVRAILSEIMGQRRGGNRPGIVQNLVRRHTESSKVFHRIATLVLKYSFMRNGVKGHHGPGGDAENGLRFIIWEMSPAHGVGCCGHVIICRGEFGLLGSNRLVTERLQHSILRHYAQAKTKYDSYQPAEMPDLRQRHELPPEVHPRCQRDQENGYDPEDALPAAIFFFCHALILP